MVRITIEDGDLVVRPPGLNRRLVERSTLRLPLKQVTGAYQLRSLSGANPGRMRGPGGEAVSGVGVQDTHTVVLELTGAKHDELLIEVDDPIATLRLIHAGIDGARD